MINHELLSQFTAKDLTINEGIAIDARLVQSASHPLKSEKLEEEKLKKQTPNGKLDSISSSVMAIIVPTAYSYADAFARLMSSSKTGCFA